MSHRQEDESQAVMSHRQEDESQAVMSRRQGGEIQAGCLTYFHSESCNIRSLL